MKTLEGTVSTIDPNFFIERRKLEDLLFRLLLLTKDYEKTQISFRRNKYELEVSDSFLQFSFFPLVRKLCFIVDYTFDDDNIHFMFYSLRENDFDAFVPNNIEPYLSLLHNATMYTKEKLNFKVSEAIKNFNELIDEEFTTDFIGTIFHGVKIKSDAEKVIIDKESAFIKNSQPIIEKIKDDFRVQYFEKFSDSFLLPFSDLVNFINAVKKNDFTATEKTLMILLKHIDNINNKSNKILAIDLVFRQLTIPSLDLINVEKYNFHFSKKLLNELYKIKNLADLLQIGVRFMEYHLQFDEDDDDYNENKLLAKAIKLVQ